MDRVDIESTALSDSNFLTESSKTQENNEHDRVNNFTISTINIKMNMWW